MSKQTDLINVTDAITVDGSNVGIGTSSPTYNLHVEDTSASLAVISGTSGNSTIFLGDTADNNKGRIIYTQSIDTMKLLTNGSERMRIDSSGRVTMPYQPFFKARPQPTVNITTQGQILPFDVVDKNIGNHYNNSTFTFTAPVNGSYVFNVMLFTPPNQTSFDYFYINGVRQTSIEQNHAPTGYTNRSDVFVVYLVAGDAVSMVHWSGTTHLNGSFAGPHSYFSGYLIG